MARYKAKRDAEVYDRSYVVSEGSRIKTHQTDRGLEHSGHVATAHGYVVVSSINETYADGSPYRVTMLEFIHNGRQWRRQFSEYFRPRTLVTLAKQFAAEIAGEGGA